MASTTWRLTSALKVARLVAIVLNSFLELSLVGGEINIKLISSNVGLVSINVNIEHRHGAQSIDNVID